MNIRSLFFPALVVCVRTALADSADDTGFTALKNALGPAMLTGAGVGISQVEAEIVSGGIADYLPQAGAGTFAGTGTWAGKTFTAKSDGGTLGAYSFHASEVALHIYGPNTQPSAHPFGWASMAPAIPAVDMWLADKWNDEFLAPGDAAPIVEVRKVQNHAWVKSATAATATAYKDLLRRQDFAIHRDKYLCISALNNGETTAVPDQLAAAYNSLCTGLSNALHSRGGTSSNMDGPGRRKPEIVVPVGATSYAAGYLSSAASLLYEKAATLTSDAEDPRVIKAALMAGATKSEFSGWAKSSAHPIDKIYGAGELNIFNSHQILAGGEQAADPTTNKPLAAWSYLSLAVNGSATFRLNVPAGTYVTELSAAAAWHRQPRDTNSGSPFVLNHPVIANYNLTLLRDPAQGGTAVTIDSSSSTLYNFEHVWARNLPAGNYRLQLGRTNDGAENIPHACGIAWLVQTAPHAPVPVMVRSGNSLTFSFNTLLTGQPYKFQSSINLTSWFDERSFTGGGVISNYTKKAAAGGGEYFRLLPVLP